MKKLAGSLMAATLLLCTATAVLADQRITSTVTVTPQSKLTDDEEDAVTLAAARLLVHVDAARQDLKKKDATAAKQEVDKAIQLGDIIKSVMPGYTIKTDVKAGDKSYSDTSTVKPLLVTLVEGLDEIAVLEPVRAAKKSVHSKPSHPTTEHLTGIEFQETEAKLDVASALNQLEDAKKALDANNSEQADQALVKLQTDVDIDVLVADMPVPQEGPHHPVVKRHHHKATSTTATKAAPKAGKTEASTSSASSK